MLISDKRGVASVTRTEERAQGTSLAATLPAARSSIETRVSLSAPARQQSSAHPVPSSMSLAAHANASDAEKYVYDAAHIPDGIGLGASEWVNGGPLRIQATGEVLTSELEANFKAESQKVQQARIELYKSEKAKGTPAADIFDMLEAHFEALPPDYRALVRSNAPG